MKISLRILSIILVVLIMGYTILDFTKKKVVDENFEIKLKASQIMSEASKALYNYKINNNIPINLEDDINATGFIGEQYTEITTTIGPLDSKRTSTNPNFSAIIVDMLYEIGIKEGETIAINFSSSFPAVNIAVLSAAEAMKIDTVIISSVGSSTYGATNTEFTYLDMEYFLFEEGILSNRSSYFSLGGSDDNGLEFGEIISSEIVGRVSGYGCEFLSFEDMDENIAARYKIYNKGEEINGFINVGGNMLSFGENSSNSFIEGGIVKEINTEKDEHGLIQLFYNDNVPVIHLLNIKDIALTYGLPLDPSPLPETGEGGVYYIESYNKVIGFIIIVICLLICLFQEKSTIKQGDTHFK